jgi:hypothetical protein
MLNSLLLDDDCRRKYEWNEQRKVCREREFFVDNLLVWIDFVIVMIGWTGLVP